MNETITAIYEQGMLRLLTPLSLPERTRVQIQIVAPATAVHKGEEHCQVRRALLDAGVIRPRSQTEPVQPVSEAQLAAAGKTLAAAGPLSELVIAEREGR